MKIVRYQDGSVIKWGVMEENMIREMEGDPFGHFHLASRTKKIEEVRLLSPCLPSKIVTLGLNYRDHAAEVKLELPKELLLSPAGSRDHYHFRSHSLNFN